ncbi:hypothetical protein AB0929_05580 [Streptomyces massasporeus]|uniref:hypothetical protein n=1 Tax=Streptomyces massasporeus TaxID=67324 RepID=UPI003455C1D9
MSGAVGGIRRAQDMGRPRGEVPVVAGPVPRGLPPTGRTVTGCAPPVRARVGARAAGRDQGADTARAPSERQA